MSSYLLELIAKTDAWTVVGLIAQALFMSRFLVQWIASEREKKSVMPVAFWFFSVAGGLGLLIYGIQRQDLVIILGQSTGLFIYCRNLWFIYAVKKEEKLSSSV